MAAPTSDSFVPGGRGFTLITPFAPSGRPTTVLTPVLAPGFSTSDLSHLIKKRERSPSSVSEQRSVRPKTNKDRFIRHPENSDIISSIDSLFPLIDVIRSGGQVRTKLEEASVIPTPKTSPGTPRFIRRPEASPKTQVRAETHGRRPLKRSRAAAALLPPAKNVVRQSSLRLQSRKLYKNDGIMNWYTLQSEIPMDAPPKSYNPADLEPGTLFVNHVSGEDNHLCQIWTSSIDGVWIPIEEGEKRAFGKEYFFLMVKTESGNPSWVTRDTFERRSRAAKRQGKMRAPY